MITALITLGLLVLVIGATLLYQLLITNYLKAKAEHQRFSATVEKRRKEMQEDFIRLGKSAEEASERFKQMNKIYKDSQKCDWENKGEDDDRKDKDEG